MPTNSADGNAEQSEFWELINGLAGVIAIFYVARHALAGYPNIFRDVVNEPEPRMPDTCQLSAISLFRRKKTRVKSGANDGFTLSIHLVNAADIHSAFRQPDPQRQWPLIK